MNCVVYTTVVMFIITWPRVETRGPNDLEPTRGGGYIEYLTNKGTVVERVGFVRDEKGKSFE